MADDLVDRLADEVAAGRVVDWLAALAAAPSSEIRKQLESLRLIQQIAANDRSRPAAQETTLPSPAPVHPANGAAPPLGQWGRYRLTREVGAGSFGSVYLASDPELDLDVALKILHRHVGDDQLKKDLLHEGRTLAKVRHQNVVRVLGVEFNGDRAGLCTEFIHGETIENEVRNRGTFSQLQATEVGAALCQALAAVHRAGFVHRDVKARNVMRELNTGRIVLMDFGTGRELGAELASTRSRLDGTAIYMAPEVLAGDPASVASDVYSVGVLLYHVLTGVYPIEGNSLKDLRSAHVNGGRIPLGDRRPDLAPSFVGVVERALAPLARRYATPGALAEELARASTDRRPVWLKRVQITMAGAGAVLAGLIALGFVNSMYLSMVLGLGDFWNEGWLDWLHWGRLSVLAPITAAGLTVLALTLILECHRVLTRLSTGFRRVAASVSAWIHRHSLDDVTLLSSASLLWSALVLLISTWYFGPLLDALWYLVAGVSNAEMRRLTLLSPGFADDQLIYRKLFSAIIIAIVTVWYPIVRLAIRTRRQLPHRVVFAGLGILAVALLLLDFPYRLFTHDVDFDEVTWNGHVCAELGQRGDESLIFCGDLPAPRNRTVPAAALSNRRPGYKGASLTAIMNADQASVPNTMAGKQKWSMFKLVPRVPGERAHH